MSSKKKISSDMVVFMRELIKEELSEESLRNWFDEEWVRIDTQGNITGPCGTMKNKKVPSRCLPKAKAQSLSKAERAATARKKKKAGKTGKQFVPNTKKAKVTKEEKAELYFTILESDYKPTNSGLWSRAIAAAKRKFDVYPSAYANAWASKWYKGKGGKWKKK
jgi:sRNA-binding protein